MYYAKNFNCDIEHIIYKKAIKDFNVAIGKPSVIRIDFDLPVSISKFECRVWVDKDAEILLEKLKVNPVDF